MRIYNINSGTSKQSFLSFLIISVVMTFAIACCYLFSVSDEHSFSGFFDWYFKTYQALIATCSEANEKIAFSVAFFILPLGIYFGTISSFVSRLAAIKKFNSTLNIKSLDFFPTGIRFNFNKPNYNISCGFSDIAKLEMVLHSILVRTKNGSYLTVKEVELIYTICNNKTFSIKNTPLNVIKFIYKIVDLNRKIENFSYTFKGAGVVEDVKEKLDDYYKQGFKQILSTPQEKQFKLFSSLFFVIGLIFLYIFRDSANDVIKDGLWFIVVPGLTFAIISFVFDFFLIADKTKEIMFLSKIGPDKENDYSAFILFFIKLVVFFTILIMFYPGILFSYHDKKILSNPISGETLKLKINPLSEYNYLTKAQIYNIRKNHVKNSLFNYENYEPNENVFGAIVDKKPWWSANPCLKINENGNYSDRIKGKSKVSAFMNNPNTLVGISLPYAPWHWRDNQEFCYGDYAKFLPYHLSYDKKNNILIAKYKITKNFTYLKTNINGKTSSYLLQLTGLNALDFGYKYVYAFDTKNIKMYKEDNLSQNVKIFTDYIHLGQSCKYEGGCNNISPMQSDKMFTIRYIPAEIDLKLWKQKPFNPFQKPDMYYKIIFDGGN